LCHRINKGLYDFVAKGEEGWSYGERMESLFLQGCVNTVHVRVHVKMPCPGGSFSKESMNLLYKILRCSPLAKYVPFTNRTSFTLSG